MTFYWLVTFYGKATLFTFCALLIVFCAVLLREHSYMEPSMVHIENQTEYNVDVFNNVWVLSRE